MKKTWNVVARVCLMLVVTMFSSCMLELDFDRELMVGKWCEDGTNYEVYNDDGTGYTWDTADDVTEEEAQQFTWTLEGSELMHIHIMEMGETSLPKVYEVTSLTDTELCYEDDYGVEHRFVRK